MEGKPPSPNGEHARPPGMLEHYARTTQGRYVRLAERWSRRFQIDPLGLCPAGAVQNAWIVLLKGLADGHVSPIQSPGQFHKTFAHLLRNVLVDESRHQRARKRDRGERTTVLGPNFDPIDLRAASPDEQVADEENVRTLLDLLDRASPALRPIIVLKLRGLSNAQIAEELQLSLSTVKRGLKTIRSVLGPHLCDAGNGAERRPSRGERSADRAFKKNATPQVENDEDFA